MSEEARSPKNKGFMKEVKRKWDEKLDKVLCNAAGLLENYLSNPEPHDSGSPGLGSPGLGSPSQEEPMERNSRQELIQGAELYVHEDEDKRKEGQRRIAKAARDGNRMAQYAYGAILMVAEDFTAPGWVEKSAQGGFVPAQLLIADMYTSGNLVHQDIEKAMWWYHQAAQNGEAGAQLQLSRRLQEVKEETGFGTPKHWLRKAALQGNETAQYEYGNLILKQGGTDKVEAYKWILSSLLGEDQSQSAKAGAMLGALNEEMTRGEVQEAVEQAIASRRRILQNRERIQEGTEPLKEGETDSKDTRKEFA